TELLEAHQAVLEGHNWNFQAAVREPNLATTILNAGRVFSAASNRSRISMAKTMIDSTLKGKSTLTLFDYPLGRVVGGSSSINGCLALRGHSEDYEEWASQGNPFWCSANVMARFQKMASFLPEVKENYAALHPVQKSFYESCQRHGYRGVDIGDPTASGIGIIPRNVLNNQRISSSIAYLGEARGRSNLAILSNTMVNRVIIEGSRAVGVEAVVDGQFTEIKAQRVILSAGAINSPLVLMRSGIGNSDSLKALDIKPKLSLPGVGQNLSDHQSIGLWYVPKPNVCKAGENLHQTLLRYSSKDTPESNDMQLYMLNSVDTNQFQELKMALGSPFGLSVTVVLGKPYSRGRVEMQDKDLFTAPHIYLNCASDPKDMLRLMEGVRIAWEISQTDSLKEKYHRAFAWNDKIIGSDKRLRESISTFVRGSWHPAGTARMGPDTQSMSVVDQYGSVHGCEQLVVVDASIMPSLPRVPTNMTCVMIGEQIAAHLMGKDKITSENTGHASILATQEETFVF
ncbi:MAG: GMC family oxidoreductase N-terminal domain-containing protein, partial [Pseudomonadales bacterium]